MTPFNVAMGGLWAWQEYSSARKEGWSHNSALIRGVGIGAAWELFPGLMNAAMFAEIAPVATEAYLSVGNSRYGMVRNNMRPYNKQFEDTKELQEYRNAGLQSIASSTSGVAPATHPNMAKYMTRRMRG